jgi:histidinol-phosphatase (PHP family)
MEEYVLAAIKAGMREICFLEHMEEGIDSHRTTWLTENDFTFYFNEGEKLKKKYAQRLNIGIGVEVGYNPEHIGSLQKRLSQRNWDRIGLSYHFHRPPEKNYHLNLVSKSDKRLQQLTLKHAQRIEETYYTSLTDAVEKIPATVVCHLDGVLRYYKGRDQLEPPWHLIEALLDAMQKRKIALEVNTSGLAIRGEVFPCRKILAMAVQRKLPLLAGSDSHRPEDIGHGFELLAPTIQQARLQ